MIADSSIINAGAAIKSSIPLISRKFGQGLGFSNPSNLKTGDDNEVLVDLSRGARLHVAGSLNPENTGTVSASGSPLNQALDAIGDLSKKIGDLQDRYAKAAIGSAQSKSLSTELKSLAAELKRITESRQFKPSSSDAISAELGSLEFSDSLVKSTLNSGNQDRIDSLTNGLKGLSSLSLEDILTDKTIPKKIQDFINTIRGALSQQTDGQGTEQATQDSNNSVLIPVPQASLQTIGQAEGLSVSLLAYSNQDLIKAAAAHMEINSTNVLILTFNAAEPKQETIKEKEEREKKSQLIELENPTEPATKAASELTDSA